MKTKTLPIAISSYWTKWLVLGLTCLSFVIPFTIGQPQFLVGTIVNACLFASAIILPKKYFWPVIIVPSLAVLLRGIIFGPLTPFLFYFLPFIWLGNFILILVFKNLYTKLGYGLSVLVSGLAKFCILYFFAQVYFSLHIVPKLFLISMGINQLLTAISGGITAYLIYKYILRAKREVR